MIEINIIKFQHDSFSNNVYPQKIIRQDSKTINPNIYDGISFNVHPYGYIYYVLINLGEYYNKVEIRFMSTEILSDENITLKLIDIFKNELYQGFEYTFEMWLQLIKINKELTDKIENSVH